MTEAYLWALGDALELIDAFAADLLSVRYREQDLAGVEKDRAT